MRGVSVFVAVLFVAGAGAVAVAGAGAVFWEMKYAGRFRLLMHHARSVWYLTRTTCFTCI
jgi:hypothetical protein